MFCSTQDPREELALGPPRPHGAIQHLRGPHAAVSPLPQIWLPQPHLTPLPARSTWLQPRHFSNTLSFSHLRALASALPSSQNSRPSTLPRIVLGSAGRPPPLKGFPDKRGPCHLPSQPLVGFPHRRQLIRDFSVHVLVFSLVLFLSENKQPRREGISK